MEKNDVFYTCYKHTWEGSKVTTEEVEAIPIEWIRKWNIDNYPYTALLMSEIIPKMIEDWEKENE